LTQEQHASNGRQAAARQRPCLPVHQTLGQPQQPSDCTHPESAANIRSQPSSTHAALLLSKQLFHALGISSARSIALVATHSGDRIITAIAARSNAVGDGQSEEQQSCDIVAGLQQRVISCCGRTSSTFVGAATCFSYSASAEASAANCQTHASEHSHGIQALLLQMTVSAKSRRRTVTVRAAH